MATRKPAPPAYVCTECGWTTAKWVGRCGECQQWGTVQEQAAQTGILRRVGPVAPTADRAARPITQITTQDAPRRSSGVGEFDRVLGGGIVPGAAILLSGEPGVGKSTLLLEVAAQAARGGRRVLYASAEESPGQVRLRAERTGALHDELYIAAETDLATILGAGVLITDFMLRHATKQLVAWQTLHPMFTDLHMHVNVSANDIANSEFINRVTRALAASGLHPQYLVAELTENILMDGIEGGYAVLDQLRALGVELAIDDFGTGYSSLASLSRLPINSLKVDASFVRDLKADSKQAEVVRAIVTLGNTLGKQVIAEGIETESQMAVLDEMGCEGGQGYLLSHPLAADEVTSLLNRLQFAHPQTPDRYSNSGFASLTQH